MSTFYPSHVVNLKLKFDESLHVQPLQAPVSLDDTLADPNTVAEAPALEPLITQMGEENVSFVMNRIPKSSTVELPGYRQAGKFNISFNFRDLPIDPRTVRSASCEIHLGAVSADDFATGMAGAEPDRTRRSILKTRIEGNLPNPETLQLVGVVDEWSVEHGADESTITMSGRDFRGVLLDTPLTNDPRVARNIMHELDLSKPIHELVQQLLGYNPAFGALRVVVNPAEWPNGVVPAPGGDQQAPRSRRGARGGRRGGRGTPNGGGNLNFWDLIVRYCFLVGAIPYFRGMVLLIRPSRSIYDQLRAGGPLNPTPFAGGDPRATDALTGESLDAPLTIRRLAFGRDVESMQFRRKFSGWQKPRVVRAVGQDPDAGARGQLRVLVGVYPPQPEAAARRSNRNGRGAPQPDIVNVPVAGVRDIDRLVEIARSVYEEIGRGEIAGAISTKSLASFGGNNQDPDLLRLKPGDGVEIFVDTHNLATSPPMVAPLVDHMRNSFEEQVQSIVSRIGDENLARVIVATSRGQVAEVQRFFRVSTVKFTWDETGVGIDFEYQNYVVSRQQVDIGDESADEGAEETVTVPVRA